MAEGFKFVKYKGVRPQPAWRIWIKWVVNGVRATEDDFDAASNRERRLRMASAAEELERVIAQSDTDILVKWQTIQENISGMPDHALRDFMAELLRTLHATNHVITEAVTSVIDDWYRRALFARAEKEDPDTPALTVEDWHKLPDRWF